MAGDWIKMRIDLQTHPKVVRILSATKADKFRAIGGLHAVWSVFDTHSQDGSLKGYTPETLDHIIGWMGFSEAMIAVGWMAFDGAETLTLPEFDEHNGKSGKRRAEDQKRKRNSRISPQSVTEESGQKADKKRTREEKRREEKEEKKPKGFQKPALNDLVLEFDGKVTDPNSEAQKFLSYYESNGWKVGRNPMKNWKSAVAGWATRSIENAKSQFPARQSRSEQNESAFRDYLARLDGEEAAAGDDLAGFIEQKAGYIGRG